MMENKKKFGLRFCGLSCFGWGKHGKQVICYPLFTFTYARGTYIYDSTNIISNSAMIKIQVRKTQF